MKKITYWTAILALAVVMAACGGEDNPPLQPTGVDLTNIEYAPQAYELPTPEGFPEMSIPADNPLTQQGVYLGRMLFYDPILSADSTQSCSSCHFQSLAFVEPRRFSVGIDGIEGPRNAMPLFNLGYNANGFFWDGRAPSLEIQALEPIENPIEMHDTWFNVETKLRRQPMYQEHFRKAFGINNSDEITRDLATKALAQFMRTMISWQSKEDKVLGNAPFTGLRPVFTEAEQRGRDLFFQEFNDQGAVKDGGDPECGHCHNTRLFTNNTYRNNGLDQVSALNDFTDKGLGGFTGIPSDNGRFRIPTLRNVELTAPYMHDGRFQTLEEVLDFYSEHLKGAPNLDGNLGPHLPGLEMSDQQKADIIAYLKTLTDQEFINDPQFSNPF